MTKEISMRTITVGDGQVAMIPVVSSNVKSIGYHEATQKLIVEFLNGTMYSYEDVPQEVFNNLKNAESVGKFLNANIKNNYTYKRHE